MSRPSWSNVGACRLRDKTFPMMESNYRPLLKLELKLLKITAIFEYINSLLLVKETHDTIFSKKTSNIPVDNESSLNILNNNENHRIN
jgi:hypothetical protein